MPRVVFVIFPEFGGCEAAYRLKSVLGDGGSGGILQPVPEDGGANGLKALSDVFTDVGNAGKNKRIVFTDSGDKSGSVLNAFPSGGNAREKKPPAFQNGGGAYKNVLTVFADEGVGGNKFTEFADALKSRAYAESRADELEKLCAGLGCRVLFAAVSGYSANLVFAALARRLKTAYAANVFKVSREDGVFYAVRKVCGSNLDAKIPLVAFPQILTVSPPAQKTARVALIGGLGLKNGENFKRLQRLAEKIGGEARITRALATEIGGGKSGAYSSEIAELVVGQSGAVIAPDLCVTFGVSGASAFMAGVEQSKKIIAVNTDADAPIFSCADYGIVADAEKALSCLEKTLLRRV
ncbi:MAG: FAD-binding protein [Clostridiales bacterium]|jgi:electron transfer flavoprotein alpha subunit|nr:FAD-binding protein [Clostridiales bacterium]